MSQQSEDQIATDLVTRIHQGDTTAEHELIVRYQRGLHFVLRRKCNQDEALAKDLVQETWVVVLSKVRNNELREPNKLAAFILQTGKNLVIGHFRKSENKHNNFVDINDEQNIADQSSTPLGFLERCNTALACKQVLLKLKQVRDREIMFRLFFRQESKEYICNELEIDTTHFDRVLFRAKQRFRQIVENLDDSS